MTLSFREIAEILKAIDESSADEINLEVDGLRLAVSKRGAVQADSTQTRVTAKVPDDNQPVERPAPTVNPADVPSSGNVAAPGHEIVRSPMVGTFYRRPSPGEASFVEIGTTVVKGSPVCLIEVMKLYTTIESTVDGEIVSIFAEDGSLVEFDQQLFLIKTSS